MPNLVTNIVEIHAHGQQLKEILSSIQGNNDVYGSFDFNKLVPMPQGLDVTHGSITGRAVCAYISTLRDEIVSHPDRPGCFEEIKRYTEAVPLVLKDAFDSNNLTYMSIEDIEAQAELNNMSVLDFLELGKKYLDNQLAYGASTWYNWRIANWGTKWELEEGNKLCGDNVLRFETAWNAPLPVIEALSRKFPAVTITHKWADEDIGYNVGQVTFLNGTCIQKDIPKGGSKKAYEMAFDVLDLAPEDLSLRYSAKAGTYVYDDSVTVDWEECASEKSSIDNIIDHAKTKALPGLGKHEEQPEKDVPER